MALPLLAVQGTLKSLLQHHSSKASVFRCSAFFTVQLSHPYTTTGKIVALTTGTFVGKVMSPLFNMLPSLVLTFLPRSKRLLISWLQSPSSVILEPPKIKSDTVYSLPIYLPWSDGTRCHDLSFLNVELQANFFTLCFHLHQELLLNEWKWANSWALWNFFSCMMWVSTRLHCFEMGCYK